MNPLGKALSKVLNVDSPNALELFANNYNGTNVSFEGFFGDAFKRIFKSDQWKEEKTVAKGEYPLKLDQKDEDQKYGKSLGPLFKKTLLNPKWIENNPGKEVEVSYSMFNLAFLFEGDDLKRSIDEYFEFRKKVVSKFRNVAVALHKVEHEIVDTFEKEEMDEDQADKYLFDSYMKMIETWKREMKPFSLKFKDIFEVSFKLDIGKEGNNYTYVQIVYDVKWLKDSKVVITPEKLVEFVKFLDEKSMYSPWSFQITDEVYEAFYDGPVPDDGLKIFEPQYEFYDYNFMFTFNESYYGNLIDNIGASEIDMYSGKVNTLMSLIDKMFGGKK